jgi:hypothetical protein
MGNRKLPFGYRMDLGQMVLHPDEAPLVRQIFEKYAAGESYKELVAALAEQGVLYDAGRAWNKNMVARILEDVRYLGCQGRFRPRHLFSTPFLLSCQKKRCRTAKEKALGSRGTTKCVHRPALGYLNCLSVSIAAAPVLSSVKWQSFAPAPA